VKQVSLPEFQRSALAALEWFLSDADDARGTGRSTVAAMAIVRLALRDPGHAYRWQDHVPTHAASRNLREKVRGVLRRYALENYAVLTESTVCIRPPAPTDPGYEAYLANTDELRAIVVPLNVTGRGLLWDSIKQHMGPAVWPIFAFIGWGLLAYHRGNPTWKLYAFLIAGMLAISVGFTVAGYRLRVRQWGMLPARRTKPATASS